jgi:hypothetical protein
VTAALQALRCPQDERPTRKFGRGLFAPESHRAASGEHETSHAIAA